MCDRRTVIGMQDSWFSLQKVIDLLDSDILLFYFISREFMYEMVRFDFLIGKELDVYLMEVL